jgi:hypothetical protein
MPLTCQIETSPFQLYQGSDSIVCELTPECKFVRLWATVLISTGTWVANLGLRELITRLVVYEL